MSGFFEQLSHQDHLNTPTRAELNGAAWVSPEIKNPDAFRGRSLPDVAAFGDPTHGIEIILGGHRVAGGGTSAAAPIWAGLIGCINSSIGMNTGWVNPSLYKIPQAFNDITSGNNRIYNNKAAFFEAAPGFDHCSGLGTPNGTALLKELRHMFTQRDNESS